MANNCLCSIKISRDIREYGNTLSESSTPYVGLARAVSPTNINFDSS